jgi:4-amino-4-deoxy-L-arabinose transferase-like glycosyltransferase
MFLHTLLFDRIILHMKALEPTTRWAAWITCGVLMVIAAGFRVYVMSRTVTTIDSDQAVLGIMAYHIQTGDRPVFFYGQPYTGSLEAYMAALLFHLFGAHDGTLRLPALAFSVVFVGIVYWLGMVLYGYRIAVVAGLFLALGPTLLIVWSTAAGANYIEAMVCGTVLLLLAVRYPDLRVMPVAVAVGGGLLAGLGLWIQPMIGEYLLPLVVTYVLRLRVDRGARPCVHWLRSVRSLVAMGVGVVAGAAPLLVYNLREHWATLSYLYHAGLDSDHMAVGVRLVTQALPVLVGLAMPDRNRTAFAQLAGSHPLLYGAGVGVGVYILARLALPSSGVPRRVAALWRGAGGDHSRASYGGTSAPIRSQEPLRWARPVADRDGVLALFATACLLVFLVSGFGAKDWATSMPRYLLPLYTITPLVLDCLRARRPGHLKAGATVLALGVLIIGNVAMTLAFRPERALYGPIERLVTLLEVRQVRVVYANYWLAYRITFETHERVLGVPITADLRLDRVRIPGYPVVATHTPASRAAWILSAHRPADDRAFRFLLQHEQIRMRRTVWAETEMVIYDHASRPPCAVGLLRHTPCVDHIPKALPGWRRDPVG